MTRKNSRIITEIAPIDHRTVVSRRRLLGGMSALAVALTSPIWRSATVFGSDTNAKPLRRFIGVFSANGTIASEFFPAGSAPDTPLTADILGRILAPCAAHVAQMLVLKGVDMVSTVTDNLGQTTGMKPGGPHMKGPGGMLTGGSLLAGSFQGAGGPAGYADRISVDQYIANTIGTKSAFPSLEFGARVAGGHPLDTISYRGANEPNPPIDDPGQMYSRMFANSNLSQSQLTQLIADRQSVLDFVVGDIQSLETKLSADDKSRLDAHLSGIRTIEQQLTASSMSCTPPAKPGSYDSTDEATFAPICQVQMDLMLLAHICGLTNVSTFMFANADSWQYYPFAGVNEEHHGLSHSSDDDAVSVEKLIKINVWHGQQVNYMLDKLAATQESDGSKMLDNTLLLWGNELGVGNTHDYKNIPWLIAGGSSYFKMGRSLQFNDLPHNNLLVSILNAMGFDDTTFGIPGCCTGALPNLTA
ncbi:MAG TPA: DUF1552 domain-containing protein [Polyangiaceae bacterium]|jgi:hypothetical protein|nr:DUF1552 domain-containing protein [Polyangiaceae bacterium]